MIWRMKAKFGKTNTEISAKLGNSGHVGRNLKSWANFGPTRPHLVDHKHVGCGVMIGV